ncbi:MAG: glycine--tRNA ligase subunit beta [Parvularculaceae bacterium]
MPDLLLELFSEEIPARMQARAAEDLQRMMNERLLAAGFLPEGVKSFAGPRRLTLIATGLPLRQADRKEEKKGPRVGAPQAAIDGFLKSAGLSSLDQCAIEEDKKGQYYVARLDRPGRATADIIAEAVPEIVRDFPWPKSMRWGDGDLAWVRPLKSVLCCFDKEVVPFAIGALASGDETRGCRAAGGAPIRVRTFEKYESALKAAKVVLDAEARRDMIAADARTLCQAQGLELVEDKGLLAEVSGLAEWPVVMMGGFDPKFLALPDEVLTASMRGHQKYFSVKDPKTGRLAAKFIFVANIEAADGGASMRRGYERVLTARLSDAWYLYHQDLKRPLESRIADLNRVTFFEGLGTLGDKARRIAALAKDIAPAIDADPNVAARAALFAKADLTSAMVYEFPELQGLMGRYYALAQGVEPAIADAIRDHYAPKGADDAVPTAPVSVAVALADRIDTLTAFWAIGKKPTGSGDPFALRRAALGIVALILENNLRPCLKSLIDVAGHKLVPALAAAKAAELGYETLSRAADATNVWVADQILESDDLKAEAEKAARGLVNALADLLAFFHDRLKVYLRDKGHRHDHIDAVLTRADGSLEDDLVLIVMKLKALEAFLKSEDGANLAAGYKRAANILKAEEKKGALPGAAAVDPARLQQAEEMALHAALLAAEEKARAAVASEKFAEAMAALASLRAAVDAFFDKVTVNADDPGLRANRLALLQRFIAATATVADLSKLEG